jgi:hypothetical protein
LVSVYFELSREKFMATVAGVEQTEMTTLSWGAVIAGAIAAAALTLLLLALGIGLGLSVVSPWGDQGVSASTFSVGAGLFLIAVSMLSCAVGGYLAGRLRVRWSGVHDAEVYFRDTAHGLLVWALATVLSVSVLGGAITHLVAGAASNITPVVTKTAPSDPADLMLDSLLRGDPASSAPAQPVRPTDAASNRDELKRLLLPAIRQTGDIAGPDRTYLARVISARTGVTQAEAEQRVSSALEQTKQAADKARKAAAKFAMWLAASMLAGALFAMLGAAEGGLLRDSKWYEPGWRADITRTH